MSKDPLGISSGDLGDPKSTDLTNDYPTISDTSVDAIADRVQPRQTASGLTRGVQYLGSDKVYSDGGSNQIIVEDPSRAKVLMGSQPTFGQGFFVAKNGVDAKTNTDPNNWIFNSNQNVFKIVTKSSSTIPAFTYGTGQTNYVKLTIPHNLKYIPIVEAYVPGKLLDFMTLTLIATARIPLPIVASSSNNGYWFDTASGAAVKLNILYGIDENNIYIQASSSVVSGPADTILSLPITYYLRQETAT